MQTHTRSRLIPPVYTGLLGGVAMLLLALVGMVEAMNKRDIITGVLTLGPGLLALTVLTVGSVAAGRVRSHGPAFGVVAGLLAGLLSGLLPALFVLLGQSVNLRAIFVSASPALYQILLFNQPAGTGVLLLMAASSVLGGLGALLAVLPERIRRPLVTGLTTVLLAGLFAEILRGILGKVGFSSQFLRILLSSRGLTVTGAAVSLALGLLFSVGLAPAMAPVRRRLAALPPSGQKTYNLIKVLVAVLALLWLPHFLGSFLSNALVLVALFALMGWGLNLELGWAGLLDLGFVAFFAVGAYTVALLTSPQVGIEISFWAALPVAVVASVLAGVTLGVPVLGVRGDYLAIATLGFGEIVRLLVLSDWMRPWLGGAQGITRIGHPVVGSLELTKPEHFYYLALAACVLAVWFATRLRDTKLGRAWRAVREDEDVAQAMGINLVANKLLAYGLGGGLAGIAGAIFGSMLGSVFPNSFHLLISINVLALIIVGGLGSLPGVFVGALLLVGLPELLREFVEYRMLVYGAVLVAMMLYRPEGFLPDQAVVRRIRGEQKPGVPVSQPGVAATPGQGG